MNLYELNQNYKNIEVLFEREDLPKELLTEALDQLQEDINQKVDNIVRYIRNLDANIKMLKEEEDNLAKKRKAIENQRKRLQEYLFDVTINSEGKKIGGKVFTVSIKKNPPSVEIEDLKLIPKHFIVNNPTVDKKALKEILKTGNIVAGARLVQGESLNIR